MALPSHYCSVATVVRKHFAKTCKYKYVCNFIYITTIIFGGLGLFKPPKTCKN